MGFIDFITQNIFWVAIVIVVIFVIVKYFILPRIPKKDIENFKEQFKSQLPSEIMDNRELQDDSSFGTSDMFKDKKKGGKL